MSWPEVNLAFQANQWRLSFHKALKCYLFKWGSVDPDGATRVALSHLESVPKRKRLSEWHHLRGLCLYDLGDPEAEFEFQAALQLSSHHQHARLYLGYCCFDQGRYAAALEWFDGFRNRYFERRDQGWRVLKNDELRLCCEFRLSGQEPSLLAFDKFRRAYAKFDPILAPVPAEIVACIEELTVEGRIKPEKLVPWLLQVQTLVAACSGVPKFVWASVERLRARSRRVQPSN